MSILLPWVQAHDRLLLIREAGEAAADSAAGAPWAIMSDPNADTAANGGSSSDLALTHVPLPAAYIAANWPLSHVAVGAGGADIAVAGRNGVALYSRATERWRLFGDVSQEKAISAQALGWLSRGVLVIASGPSADDPRATNASHELLLLPRYHLDIGSLLARHSLGQAPLAVDCVGSTILVAMEPLEITLFEVEVVGALNPNSTPKATLSVSRQISMLDVGRPLLDLALVPQGTVQAVMCGTLIVRQCDSVIV